MLYETYFGLRLVYATWHVRQASDILHHGSFGKNFLSDSFLNPLKQRINSEY